MNTEYEVVVSSEVVGLEKEVTAKLKDGWKLAGGLAIQHLPHSNLSMYMQAMYWGGSDADQV